MVIKPFYIHLNPAGLGYAGCHKGESSFPALLLGFPVLQSLKEWSCWYCLFFSSQSWIQHLIIKFGVILCVLGLSFLSVGCGSTGCQEKEQGPWRQAGCFIWGIFLCWSIKSSIFFFFFSTNTCSWVQGRKELVVQFHRHSKEEWSRARWQLQRKGDADPHQTGLMDSWLCSREAPRAPGSRITFASPDLLLYLNCIWSLSARSFHAHLQTSVFFPLNAF